MLPLALGNAGTLWKWLGAEPEERNHQKLGFGRQSLSKQSRECAAGVQLLPSIS